MSKYYCSIGEQLSNKIPNKPNTFVKESLPNVRTAFRFSPLTPQQLIKTMSKFKTSKGFGVDNISSFFLKKGMPILASSLSQLFNLSISRGQFPDSWKVARVVPIYKDGPTYDRSNYRPISVLPVVARLFEKLIYEQLYSYLNKNSLLFSGQSGFRSHHSVLTSLFHCMNDWYLNLDKGQYTSVTFIDLMKAFDNVDYQILLQKVRVYGIEGKEYLWFLSYLKTASNAVRLMGVYIT